MTSSECSGTFRTVAQGPCAQTWWSWSWGTLWGGVRTPVCGLSIVLSVQQSGSIHGNCVCADRLTLLSYTIHDLQTLDTKNWRHFWCDDSVQVFCARYGLYALCTDSQTDCWNQSPWYNILAHHLWCSTHLHTVFCKQLLCSHKFSSKWIFSLSCFRICTVLTGDMILYMQKFSPISPLFSLANFYHVTFWSCVNNYTGDMATFTALLKIYSTHLLWDQS